MSNRAFFVLGPESSGTRLAAQILINAGCYGSADHVQVLDDDKFDLSTVDPTIPIVWRRSFPHDGRMPNLADMVRRVKYRQVTAIVTVRDWTCIHRSQLRDNQHATTPEQADRNISQAYELIFHKLRICNVGFRTFVYESMVHDSQAQERFLESLGLSVPSKLIEVYDGNEKYNRKVVDV